ncbi:hypothetical protein G9A89_021737 [Geosiphon pyriformis]|nr:hypothetical protein G9A89_021737 [Geosiphon pyriformis]
MELSDAKFNPHPSLRISNDQEELLNFLNSITIDESRKSPLPESVKDITLLSKSPKVDPCSRSQNETSPTISIPSNDDGEMSRSDRIVAIANEIFIDALENGMYFKKLPRYIYKNICKKDIEAVELFNALRAKTGTRHLPLLGFCHEFGIGTTINQSKAVEIYHQSAECDDKYAQNFLCRCYRDATGTKNDDIKAFYWAEKSAMNGFTIGQYNLAYCYENAIGTLRRPDLVYQWYMKSAMTAENAMAQFAIGFCYNHGCGVAEDKAEAFNWYIKSAENGYEPAQNRVGFCYRNGLGVQEDSKIGFGWHLKAANSGDPHGQCVLASCYFRGIGTKIDYKKAVYWYQKSADGEHYIGQSELAMHYLRGNGVPKDSHQAIKYCRRSIKGGQEKNIHVLFGLFSYRQR